MTRPAVAAGLLAASLIVSGAAALAQDLGRGRGQLIEGGPVDLPQLVARSSLIVQGSIVSREARWIGRVIYTQYELLVQQTLKGAVRSGVFVAVVGGAVGNVQLTVPGAPDVSVGDQLVLFGQPLDGGGVFTPVGTFDGIVPIRQPRANAGPTVSPRGKPEDLATFLEEVRALSKQQP